MIESIWAEFEHVNFRLGVTSSGYWCRHPFCFGQGNALARPSKSLSLV